MDKWSSMLVVIWIVMNALIGGAMTVLVLRGFTLLAYLDREREQISRDRVSARADRALMRKHLKAIKAWIAVSDNQTKKVEQATDAVKRVIEDASQSGTKLPTVRDATSS